MQRRRRRRRSTAENPSLSSILPDELVEAILLRLPVSSLLRFKCVSKLWLSLISNPQFAKSQFDLAASPTHRLLLNCTDDSQIQSLDIESSPPNDDESAAVLNYTYVNMFYRFITSLEVLGSCRGFLLFLLPNFPPDYIVCNPATGVQRRIRSTRFRYSNYLYGIGYDESTDDYLLVAITSCHFWPTIELFSLRTNVPFSLRLKGKYRYINLKFDCRSGLFLNGSLHWLVTVTSSDTNPRVLLAFDLVSKSLSEIALSPGLALELNKGSYCLREMRGCVGLCYSGYGEMAEIWIMKEYKVQSSWTKIVLSYDILSAPRFFPICFTKCGDVFGSNVDGRLLRLNNEGKTIAFWPPGESKYRSLYSCMYTASLLSLPS
ncbi:F-box/kelch-repeat protein At3g06240-like [Lotus japonicus]|uniref:F-box/kelch-repeat protein At3g06240-like n=1 Tax=Lotus japonicus TaxID=34305 RepID=UPI002584392B|nr:F-box/kelch-repeat protein At3g06240-like [Lotus japonicus]